MSQSKSSEVLNKKKKPKFLYFRNYALNDGSNMYVLTMALVNIHPLLPQIMGKMHTKKVILAVKKSEHDKLIIITHDKDFWQVNEQK